MELISLNRLNVEQRLSDINLTVAAGELIGIIGPNGSGKSTLIKAIVGLIKSHGEIELLGQSLHGIPAKTAAQLVSYLPQQSELHWSLAVKDVVNLGRAPWDFTGASFVDAAMQACNVNEFSHRPVNQLSGGEQTRVHLARVLATQSVLLCADEPLASLDFLYQKQVMNILRDYTNHQRAVLVSIHDLGMAARFCDKLCLMHHGKILAFGDPRAVLTPENITTAYGVDVFIDLDANPPIVVAK